MGKIERGEKQYATGVTLDNSGDMKGALKSYSKAMRASKHPMAFYCRACVYKDMGKYKEAIADFRSYMDHGPRSSPEWSASQTTIEELEAKISKAASVKGARSPHLCPRCNTNFLITEWDAQGIAGAQKLECPACGGTMIKIRP